MPWDARSCRVFLEIPDKSWCCYLAFDSFPCMEAKSSRFFLCSALAHPVLGAGLTPLHHSNRTAQLELYTSQPRSWRGPHEKAPRSQGGRRVQELPGSSGKREQAQLSHPGCQEERSSPTPAPIHGQQPALPHLSPSLGAQPWLWAAQGKMIMPTL